MISASWTTICTPTIRCRKNCLWLRVLASPIYYGSPDKKEFQNIVRVLADKYHIHMPEADLLLEANKWELSHGGLSGRTATQFMQIYAAS